MASKSESAESPDPSEDASPTPPPAEGEVTDDEAVERPAFAAQFPRDVRLDALLTAFQQGNFAKVRTEASRLAEISEDEAVQAAALELRSRIEPSKVATLLWCVGVMLMLALYGFYWSKQHG